MERVLLRGQFLSGGLADPGGPADMDFNDIPVPGSDSDQTVQYDDLYCKDLVISDDHQDWMFLTAEERVAAMTRSWSVCSTAEGSLLSFSR